ncbi:hypothetical protein AB0I72_23680 [Nocardiopsis sp. NPDC049922]
MAGGHRDYLVAATRYAAVWNAANEHARDDAVARIRAALGRAHG